MSAKLEVLRLAEQAAREAFLLESKHFEAEHSDDPFGRGARPAMDRLLAAGERHNSARRAVRAEERRAARQTNKNEGRSA
jgi:hypothetical protein